MDKPKKKQPQPKLTPAQRRKVREYMEDSGWPRAMAVAWVLSMESED